MLEVCLTVKQIKNLVPLNMIGGAWPGENVRNSYILLCPEHLKVIEYFNVGLVQDKYMLNRNITLELSASVLLRSRFSSYLRSA